MELLDLCYDVLIHILEEVDAVDLASCARTSRSFRDFIYGNERLFRAYYLQNLDDPRHEKSQSGPDWIEAVKRLVTCQKIMESHSMTVKDDNFRYVASTIAHFLNSAQGESKNHSTCVELLRNPRNQDVFLKRSSLYWLPKSHQAAENEEDRQLSAKLHCLHGISRSCIDSEYPLINATARSRVYDLRNYTDQNYWGPFRDDGSERVDWEMVEAIMQDLQYNCGVYSGSQIAQTAPLFEPRWNKPFEGISKKAVKTHVPLSLTKEPDIPLKLRDPYNVTGIWHRVICFLDYNDLYHFNFRGRQPPPDQPRPPAGYEEEIRHIIVKLEVTDIVPPGKFDNQLLPIAHFEGVSKLINGLWDPSENTKLRGMARLTQEGEVRWSTVTIFPGGEERWASEAIQIGGINSERGAIGTWFDKDFDPHGPAGPTAFWKVSNDVDNSDSVLGYEGLEL